MPNKHLGILHYNRTMLRELLLLPHDMKIKYAYPDDFGSRLAVVVKSSKIPTPLDGHLTELTPLYTLDEYERRWRFMGFDGQ